ncbi:MAG TPA: HAMP domain-containing sensor histidine kinase [Candidatus Didemnitutus sp.]|jgi:signal transduction histidine kinase
MNPRILLLPDESGRFADVAQEAARVALPQAGFARMKSWTAIAGDPGGASLTLVIDCTGDPAVDERLISRRDASGLPAWAVIARGAAAPGAVPVSDEAWSVASLAALLPVVLRCHGLDRENEQFRGDLMAVGIRVAHDLKSPLNGIVSGTELLEDFLSRQAAGATELLSPLRDSTTEMARIIGHLALWARLSAQRFVPQAFNMEEPARRAREKFEARAALSGASLVSSATWPTAIGDPDACEIVWRALIENALVHGGPSPKIEMTWARDGVGCRFIVRDHGPGVDADKVPGLFRPFHRLHEPDSLRGLGLPMVERLMQLQGGHCGYEKGEADGATFYFYLPSAGDASAGRG